MAHYLKPKPRRAHLLVCYRNFSAQPPKPKPHGKPPHPPHPPHPHPSHVGLGVNAINTAKVLRMARIKCDVSAVWDANDIRRILRQPQHGSVSHCLIEAPFIGAEHMMGLLRDFPDVQFICRCHSNIGFLQVEAGAINLIRQYLLIQDAELNFDFAANSTQFSEFIEDTYNTRCTYLPNLYDLKRKHSKSPHGSGNKQLVRIASFGAIRLMKNHSTAAAAAMVLAHRANLDLEFYINVAREEHGKGVLQALRNMFANVRWAKLIEIPWESWSEFRRTISHMDLAYQLSMSETFNLVSADAVAEGVPVAGSEAIEWLPADSQCHMDDVDEAATVGGRLLHDPRAADKQLKCLQKYQKQALERWIEYLSNKGKQIALTGDEADEEGED